MARNALAKGISLLGKFLASFVALVLKIWRPIIFMIVLVLIIVLFAIWVASIISFFFTMPYAGFLLPGSRFVSFLGFLNVFIFIGVPFLALVLRGSRFLLKRQVLTPRWKAGMWSVWGLNIISLFAVASFTGRQFSEGQQESQSYTIENLAAGDTLHLDLLENLSSDAMIQIDNVILSDLQLHDGNVDLSLKRSRNGKFELEKRFYSRGQSSEEAALLANEIRYEVDQQNGKLIFPRGFIIERNSKWRGQNVEMTLWIPEGQYLTLNSGMNQILQDIDVQEYSISPWRHRNRVWKMGSEGLVCSECPESKVDDEQFTNKDFDQLQIEGKMKIEISQGEAFKIRLTGKEIYTRRVEMVQTGNILSINADLKDPGSPVRLYITLPHLASLDLEKTDDVKILGFSQPQMRIKNDSHHDLKAFVNVDSLHLIERGRTEIDIRGSGKYLKAKLSDRSRLDAEHYTVDVADIRIENSAKASVSVVDTLRRSSQNGYDRIRFDSDPKIVIDSQ